MGTQFSKDKTVCNLAKVADSKLWHKTLGHLNFSDIKNRIRRILHCAKDVCEIYILCKFTKVSSLNETENKNTNTLEKGFIDILGHLKPPSVQQIRIVFIIVDEYSNFKVVKFLRTKSDAPEKFKHFIAGHGNLELLKSVDGIEFTSKHFKRYSIENKAKQVFAMPETREQSGLAERTKQTIVENSKSLLVESSCNCLFFEEPF